MFIQTLLSSSCLENSKKLFRNSMIMSIWKEWKVVLPIKTEVPVRARNNKLESGLLKKLCKDKFQVFMFKEEVNMPEYYL